MEEQGKMTEVEVETGTKAQAPVQAQGVGPLSLESSSKLTQDIYSVFVDSFPDLFAEPAAEEEEQGAGEGEEGDAEGGESPTKGQGSPAKSSASELMSFALTVRVAESPKYAPSTWAPVAESWAPKYAPSGSMSSWSAAGTTGDIAP